MLKIVNTKIESILSQHITADIDFVNLNNIIIMASRETNHDFHPIIFVSPVHYPTTSQAQFLF